MCRAALTLISMVTSRFWLPMARGRKDDDATDVGEMSTADLATLCGLLLAVCV